MILKMERKLNHFQSQFNDLTFIPLKNIMHLKSITEISAYNELP